MKTLSTQQPTLQFDGDAPEWAYYFAQIGPTVRDLLSRYLGTASVLDCFGQYKLPELEELASALRHWSDELASKLLEHLLETCRNRQLEIPAITRWALLQRNDPEGVSACMDLVAPREIEIIRLLPRTGSQKLVFEARWRLVQRRVVLKKLTGTAIDVAKVASHELHSHPLSIRHPNIIETHFVSNGVETFLVEELLPKVLFDSWKPSGIQETANLLYSLTKAIETVHQMGYVHGDIKPDNIGKKDDRFLLLDFGICRPARDFTPETTATGSLRTRAPELLANEKYVSAPEATDIWAIGATLFNFQEGRFPLVRRDERVPRVSNAPEREAFERMLSGRANDEWDQWVTFDKTPNVLRPMLASCLDRDPARRPAATDLREKVEHALPAYIPEGAVGQDTSFPPVIELAQLSRLLRNTEDVRLLPADDRGKIRSRILVLKERMVSSQDPTQSEQLSKLEKLFGA